MQTADPGERPQPPWEPLRGMLEEVSMSRAQLDSGRRRRRYVLSLKQTLFDRLRSALASQPEKLATLTWEVSLVLDKLELFTTDRYQRRRE